MTIKINDNFFGNYEQDKKLAKNREKEFILTLSDYVAKGGKFLSFLPDSQDKDEMSLSLAQGCKMMGFTYKLEIS